MFSTSNYYEKEILVKIDIVSETMNGCLLVNFDQLSSRLSRARVEIAFVSSRIANLAR